MSRHQREDEQRDAGAFPLHRAPLLADRPGEAYNPLFIYGGVGLGKTHLMHAIGNEIQAHNKNALVLYQTADRFVTEFINPII